MKIAPFIILGLIIFASAASASIDNVARVEQKGYVTYDGWVYFFGFNSTLKIVLKYLNYTEVSEGVYNVTIEKDDYMQGSRDNETDTITRNFTDTARLGTFEEGYPLFDNNRYQDAIDEVKNFINEEYGLNPEVSSEYKITVGDKTFTVVKVKAENDTFKIEVEMAIHAGFVSYLYLRSNNTKVGYELKASDTNVEEVKPQPTGGSVRFVVGALIIALVVIAAVLYYAKTKGAAQA